MEYRYKEKANRLIKLQSKYPKFITILEIDTLVSRIYIDGIINEVCDKLIKELEEKLIELHGD